MEGTTEEVTATSGTKRADTSGFLHVIFHGLFCFFELDDYILVRVPFIPRQMSGSMSSTEEGHAMSQQGHGGRMPYSPQQCASDHVYRAGSWLGETTLQPGFYELKGVRHEYARFSRTNNMVIQGATPAPRPQNLYAEIIFPYPHKITSIEPIDAPKGKFSGGAVDNLSSETLSLLQVFTYVFDREEHLKLRPHSWSPNPHPKSGGGNQELGGFISLHLFAEPDILMKKPLNGTGHTGHAFSTAIQMFNKVDLQLTQQLDTPDLPRIADLPFGTRREEMEDLDTRNDRLAVLGLLRKEGENLNRAFDGSPFVNASDAERCAGLIGGG